MPGENKASQRCVSVVVFLHHAASQDDLARFRILVDATAQVHAVFALHSEGNVSSVTIVSLGFSCEADLGWGRAIEVPLPFQRRGYCGSVGATRMS